MNKKDQIENQVLDRLRFKVRNQVAAQVEDQVVHRFDHHRVQIDRVRRQVRFCLRLEINLLKNQFVKK